MTERIAIVGLGLIGGSLALALRRARPGLQLVGVDDDAAARGLALAAGAVDEAAVLERAQLSRCSLAVLAVPAQPLLELILPLCELLPRGATLTDVCGAKEEIVRRAQMQQRCIFVGGHPMAGTEFHGFAAARADLFQGAVVALCPPVGGPEGADVKAAVAQVESLWTAVGAVRLLTLDPAAHDHAVTFASHLPYLAAASVVEALHSAGAAQPLARDLAAGGFRDTTRVAGDFTLSGALSQNRFLPAAARALAAALGRLADEVEQDPARAVERLRALADERRAMVLPPRPEPRSELVQSAPIRLLLAGAAAALAAGRAAQTVPTLPPDQKPAPPPPPPLTPPKLVQNAEAEYPAEQVAERRAARVILKLDLDATGAVAAATVVSPPQPGFDESALTAARKLKFSPAMQGETPIAVRIQFAFNFAAPPPPAAPSPAAAAEEKPVNLAGMVRERGTRKEIAGHRGLGAVGVVIDDYRFARPFRTARRAGRRNRGGADRARLSPPGGAREDRRRPAQRSAISNSIRFR